MQSFTFGTDEFIQAILDKGTKEKYPIEFGATNFTVFVKILSSLSRYAEVSHNDFKEIPGYGGEDTEPIEDWATQILSAIAETLGIEGI